MMSIASIFHIRLWFEISRNYFFMIPAEYLLLAILPTLVMYCGKTENIITFCLLAATKFNVNAFFEKIIFYR